VGKAPAFQFYVKDWLTDPQLKMASHSTKGIWIDLICFMWQSPIKGEVVGAENQITRMIGAINDDMDLFYKEAEELKFADVTKRNKKVTIRNRRMFREQKVRENTRERVYRHRAKKASNAECNGKVTPLSPTPSPTPTTYIKKSPAGGRPSEDEINNASSTKLNDYIKTISDDLYDTGVFKKVHVFVNTMKKEKKSDRAILHTLTRCQLKSQIKAFKGDDAWGYCAQIIKIENGNFNEREYQKSN
jgi:hypothetical protein